MVEMGLLLRVCIAVTGIVVVGNIAVLGAMRATFRDPFAPYQTIMPEQPTSELPSLCRSRPFQQRSALYHCQFDPRNDDFRDVVLEAHNGIITKMSVFDIYPNKLSLGDLIICWGRPMSVNRSLMSTSQGYERLGSFLEVYWENTAHAELMPASGSVLIDFRLPVYYVEFYDPVIPCGSSE
jgi:hypothetical protein